MGRPSMHCFERHAVHARPPSRSSLHRPTCNSNKIERQALFIGRSHLWHRSSSAPERAIITCSSSSSGGFNGAKSNLDAARDNPSGPGTRLQATTSKSVSAPTVTNTYQSNQAAERIQRLTILVQLRRLYQNILHAEVLLSQPTPVYQPKPPSVMCAESTNNADADSVIEDEEEEDRKAMAIEVVAEMQLTADELEAGLKSLQPGFGSVYRASSAAEPENAVRERVRHVVEHLRDRVNKESALLPFPSIRAAQAVLDAKTSRFSVTSVMDSMDSDGELGPKSNFSAKLGKAERVAERFVSEQLPTAVKKVRLSTPKDWAGNVKAGAVYAKELWDRLNGGGQQKMVKRVAEGLPLPQSAKDTRSAAIASLTLELGSLEKQIKDSSKQREARLRNADISTRARMASELRKLDDEVATLTRTLAVRTLQLEMEFIYGSLEEEALDVAVKGTVLNMGSDDELALLSAEFAIMDEQLAALQQLVDRGSAIVISEEELVRLATEIPDLRSRLGIGNEEVFGGSGISLLKLQMQVKEALGKVKDGVDFGARGVRLLFSDIGNSGRLFWRAALGDTLKPREVLALRRTARDVLTFVPFTIILVAPITPVGHVLVFGFIQRYFPGFFPSQFTTRRQDIMVRYEELQKQLATAQELAAAEDEEQELARATAAVARLTAPIMSEEVVTDEGKHDVSSSESYEEDVGDSAAARVEKLQKQVQEAEEATLAGPFEDEEKLLDKEKRR